MFTACNSSSTVTIPSPLESNTGHSVSERTPRAMFTPVMISSTVTMLSPLQSPVSNPAPRRRRCGRGVGATSHTGTGVGVAVAVAVGEGGSTSAVAVAGRPRSAQTIQITESMSLRNFARRSPNRWRVARRDWMPVCPPKVR
jgi:hypothetical protein